MSVENILSKLPLAPGKEHLEHLMEVDEEAFDELYKDYCFYERISVITNEDAFTEAFGFLHKPAKTGYGARCRCTACNNYFTAGYKNSKSGESNGGIILIQGPDGIMYDGYACMEDENALFFREDEFLECPLCGEMIFVRRASSIAKEGELYALRSQEIVNIDNYTSVMTWEWRRWLTAGGCSDGCTIPVSAVIIDEEGYLADLISEAPKEINLEKITNYLKKQNCNNSRGAGLYLDYIDMVGFDDKELFYPKMLEIAHDEAANTLEFKKTKKSKDAFKRVYAKYSQLEWTDGELSVILPRYPEELTQEGKTLHHCVGRYVEKHAGGKDIIFFVRHKRRPERSYYTLNIDFSCGKPREIQLHGYGNERHGPNKQYSHSIPPKVRAFVDRWEKEVLYPWYRTQVKAKINQKTA